MKHYEFVILFHPNQSERVSEMLERYASQITDQYSGVVHRVQDLDRKKLHYTIQSARTAKAHFAVINFTCSHECLEASLARPGSARRSPRAPRDARKGALERLGARRADQN